MRIRSTPCLGGGSCASRSTPASRRSAAIICHVAAVMPPESWSGAEGHAVQELRLLSPDVDETTDGLHDQDEEVRITMSLDARPEAHSTSPDSPGHLGPPFSGSPPRRLLQIAPCSCRVETVMGRGWVETGAGVEWFSGHRALERPVRLRLGGRCWNWPSRTPGGGASSGGRELIRVSSSGTPGAGVFVFRPMTAGGSGGVEESE